MPRLFIGLSLPEPIKTQLSQQQDYFRLVLDESWFRFSTAEQQHLTLVFLGNVAEQQIEAVKQSLRFACRKQTAFKLSLSSLGAFPSRQRPSILWAGIKDESRNLQNLHHNLGLQLEGIYKRETQSFKPHLTLARVKRFGMNESIFNALENAPHYPDQSWIVNEIQLYSSQRLASGARYDVLYTQELIAP